MKAEHQLHDIISSQSSFVCIENPVLNVVIKALQYKTLYPGYKYNNTTLNINFIHIFNFQIINLSSPKKKFTLEKNL
jgi:hypothetical protein